MLCRLLCLHNVYVRGICIMLTIKEIIDAWQKVYGEDMPVFYSGFISELEKIVIKKNEVENAK